MTTNLVRKKNLKTICNEALSKKNQISTGFKWFEFSHTFKPTSTNLMVSCSCKCKECDYKFKHRRKQKKHQGRNHAWKRISMVWQALNSLNNFHLWRCEDADWEIASEGTVCEDERLFAGLFLGPCLVCGNKFIIYEQVKKHPRCYQNNSLCFNKLANMQKLILLIVYYSF